MSEDEKMSKEKKVIDVKKTSEEENMAEEEKKSIKLEVFRASEEDLNTLRELGMTDDEAYDEWITLEREFREMEIMEDAIRMYESMEAAILSFEEQLMEDGFLVPDKSEIRDDFGEVAKKNPKSSQTSKKSKKRSKSKGDFSPKPRFS
ncbi:MAG: hypothetical protein LBF22_14900 [Deltaproteobacteria bacterium]|jgi:hypothetical protein|nr:hypothetical protein [Deltaproteobacteria bacterium]